MANKEHKTLKDFEALYGKTDLGLGDNEEFVDVAADLFKSDEDSSDSSDDEGSDSDDDED